MAYYEVNEYYRYCQYPILKGLDNEGKIVLEYSFAKESLIPYHILFLGEKDNYYHVEFYKWDYENESYEGVWIFTYIGLDTNNNRIDFIIVNSTSNKILH